MRQAIIRQRLTVLLLIITIFAGCAMLSTRKGFYEPIVGDLRADNYGAAVKRIEEARREGKYARKDRFLYFLDAGLAYHYAGIYDSSITRLTSAENTAEELFTKSISRAATSLLLNDNVLEYAGEDYEVLYTNLFKALDFVSKNEFDEAFVEIRRANLKLELLEQKYAQAAEQLRDSASDDSGAVSIDYQAEKVRFNNSAFARYQSMHMYAAEGKWDDARIDLNLLSEAFTTQPHVYPFAAPPVDYAADSGSILSVVALVGLAPVKEPLALRIRTDKQLDLVQVLYDGPGKQDVLYGQIPMSVNADYYFKFAIPVIAEQPTSVRSIRVWRGEELLGELHLLEDVASVAKETFAAKKSLIYLRSVARAVTKGLAAHELKEKLDKDNAVSWLAKLAVDIGSDVIENPDLRCSRLLPGRIMVGDFVVEPGTYELTVEFLDVNGALLTTRHYPGFRVYQRGLNMIEATYLN